MTKKTTNFVNLRASSAHIWQTCPGSLTIKTEPNFLQDDNEAKLGTLIHTVAENLLQDRKVEIPEDVEHFIDFIAVERILIDLSNVDGRMIMNNIEKVYKYVKFYIEAVESVIYTMELNGYKVEKQIEKYYSYTYKGHKIHGTADMILIGRGKNLSTIIHVMDLKTGFLEVLAAGNRQLKTYLGLCIKSENLDEDIELFGTIVQPALSIIDTEPFETVLSPKELIQDHIDRGVELKTGKQCTYCDKNDICSELRKRLKKYLNPKWHDTSLYRPKIWQELLEVAKPLVKMLEQVQSTALSAMKMGVEIPGYELGYRSAKRTWNQGETPQSLAKKLRLKPGELLKTTLNTPKTIEDHLKKLEKTLLNPFRGKKCLSTVQKTAKIRAESKVEKMWDGFGSSVYAATYQVLKRSKE